MKNDIRFLKARIVLDLDDDYTNSHEVVAHGTVVQMDNLEKRLTAGFIVLCRFIVYFDTGKISMSRGQFKNFVNREGKREKSEE